MEIDYYFSPIQRINLCSIYFFFGSTSDFALNTFCSQYILVSFNAIASVQLFLFKFQEHILRSTIFISFSAIYLRSTIYCSVVEVPASSDLARSRGTRQ